MAHRISMVDGVAQVALVFARRNTPSMCAKSDTLGQPRAFGIDQVAVATRSQGQREPTLGTLYGAHKSFTLQASGQLMSANPYRS
jgi:HAE1 family hydrophobic/amphiphilic exporter-1